MPSLVGWSAITLHWVNHHVTLGGEGRYQVVGGNPFTNRIRSKGIRGVFLGTFLILIGEGSGLLIP